MKRLLVTMILVITFASTSFAATFLAQGKVHSDVSDVVVTVTLSGHLAQQATTLVRYRDFKNDQGKWKDEFPVQDCKVSFDATEGNSFQLVDRDGKFVLITSTMFHNQEYGRLTWSGRTGIIDTGRGFKFYVK